MLRPKYTSALLKGTGALDDVMTLLDGWKPGMSGEQLGRVASEMLGKRTRQRAADVARVFSQRLLVEEGRPARMLQRLRVHGAAPADLRLLLFVFTARANTILQDYVTEVYWPRYQAGAQALPRAAADAFLHEAEQQGRIAEWSLSTKVHVAQNLNGTLTDFGLLTATPPGARRFTTPVLSDVVVGALVYEARERGVSDDHLVDLHEWALFGLERYDVVQLLHRLSRRGHLTVQDAGHLVRIYWPYPSLDAALDALV